MRRVLLLNDIDELEVCLKAPSVVVKEMCAVLTTDPSVQVLLKEKYGIEAVCLCKYISPEEGRNNIEHTDQAVGKIVDFLDSRYSAHFSELLKVKGMRLFSAVYSYRLYLQYNGVFSLLLGLNRAIEEYNPEELICFERKMDFGVALKDVVGLLQGIKVFVNPAPNGKAEQLPGVYERLLRRIKWLAHPSLLMTAPSKIKESLSTFNPLRRKRGGVSGSILLFDNLYDLAFLKTEFPGNAIVYKYESQCEDTAPNLEYPLALKLESVEPDTFTPLQRIMAGAMIDDFNANSQGYLRALVWFKDFCSRHDFKAAIWGDSPVECPKALIVEYLLAKGIKVVGAQHGGMQVPRINDELYWSEFSRCNQYISYGFTKNDVHMAWPWLDPDKVTVLDFGSSRAMAPEPEGSQTTDILFPAMFNRPMLDGGVLREKPETITSYQKSIIEFLDANTKYTSIIKPFPYPNYKTLSVLPILEKKKRLRVVDEISFADAMFVYKPRAVVLELASTTLYEALPRDCDIFLMLDRLRPILPDALESLKKRVYCFDSMDELLSQLGLFLEGKLAKKRDLSFYNRYVFKSDSKEQILAHLEAICARA